MNFRLKKIFCFSKKSFVSEWFGVEHLCPALESNLNGKLLPSACRPLQQRLVYKLSGFSENGLTISKEEKGKKAVVSPKYIPIVFLPEGVELYLGRVKLKTQQINVFFRIRNHPHRTVNCPRKKEIERWKDVVKADN